MKKVLLKKFFSEKIAPFFFQKGFVEKCRKDGPSFRRTIGEAQQSVGFTASKRTEGGFWIFCGLGVRYPDLEELVALGDPARLARETGTIGGGIHLLHSSPYPYYEYVFDEQTDWDSLADTILSRVRDYGIPYIEKFSEKNVLKEALVSRSRDLHNLDSRGYVMVLAALLFTEGRRAEALAVLQAALADKDNEFPKHQIRLGELLAYLKAKMRSAN